MPVLSYSAAARAAGVSRSTIHRALKAGRLSASTRPDGTRGVDTTELLRVYGELHDAVPQVGQVLQAGVELEAARREVALLRELLDAERAEKHRALQEQQRMLTLLERNLLPKPGLLDRMASAWRKARGD